MTASSEIRLTLEPNDEAPACQAVCALLRDHNWNANPELMQLLTSPKPKDPINLIAWSEQAVVGGLLGYTQRKWLRIDILAVAPDHRQRGIGTSLMREAERLARLRGCCYGYVDTLEHQAPGFYLRFGYQSSGEIKDWDSRGNAKYFLTRRIAPDSG
ncbi:GNAT family N-acetyltransferase [Roseiconus nitratireducens]|uniref:GNAT family N-acetyltransferase n=1 Tax=Roseiconus nitratireducens TaxID=2605748 RepID=A0A5M6CT41_9BACT|nr:GNAT family N-acetyltransferase [Roseiconus nitratireducens]KAA5537550.1 GNAT family N-acetyltransferase [Roseiconus nitratireducens]